MSTFLLEGRYVTNSYIYHLLHMSVIKYKYTYLNLPVPNERSTFTLHGTIAESDASFILQRVDVTSDDQPASRRRRGEGWAILRERQNRLEPWTGAHRRRHSEELLSRRRGICWLPWSELLFVTVVSWAFLGWITFCNRGRFAGNIVCHFVCIGIV